MVLSDDDLKKLKNFVPSPDTGMTCEIYDPESGITQYTDRSGSRVTLDLKLFQGLLQRLEAAEANERLGEAQKS